MSISAMKQALEALVSSTGELRLRLASPTDAQLIKNDRAITALRQAIAEAEKQEPVVGTKTWFEDGKMVTQHLYASDISQERVDETAKDQHQFEEMVKKGTKAWDGTPDNWVDDLRGGAEKQEAVAFRNTETGEFCTGGFLRKDWAKWQPLYAAPVTCDDDIYDVWKEKT